MVLFPLFGRTCHPAVLLLVVMSNLCSAQDPLLDDLPQPGLMASFTDPEGRSRHRVDDGISINWDAGVRPPGLSIGEIKGNWEGLIRIRTSGEYQFFALSSGPVDVLVDDVSVVKGEASEIFGGEPVQLRPGLKSFRARWSSSGKDARLKLFWTGPGFDIEPLNPDNLLHEHDQSNDDRFNHAVQLFESARCGGCHSLPGSIAPLDAPSLDRLRGNLNPDWVVERLSQSVPDGTAQQSMPHFQMSRSDAQSITAFLFSASAKQAAKPLKPLKIKRKKGAPQNPGEQLFVGLGCLSCHDSKGDPGLSTGVGGNLSVLGSKRPIGFVRRWLSDAASINSRHQMPSFPLTDVEAFDLANHIETIAKIQDKDQQPKWLSDSKKIAQGGELIGQYRCYGCHQLGARVQPRAPIALSTQSDWSKSCLSEERSNHRPLYRLRGEAFDALKSYVRSLAAGPPSATHVMDGADLLRRNHCLECHRRESGKGNEELALRLAGDNSEFISHVAELIPPSLNAIGDKFKPDALIEAVSGKMPRRRPWLKTRMPRFRMSDPQLQTLSEWFISQDRNASSSSSDYDQLSNAQLHAIGPRLVTSTGFGCASCHQIGDVVPAKAPLNSRGPDLAGLGKRVRKQWFERWVADPLRIVPRVEMPAIKVPIDGVLGNDLDTQIDAVWHVLNLENFRPPRPDPVRVVRHTGRDAAAKAHVLTDVLRLEKQVYIKPLLIGLANRHNVFFDLEQARLTGWWIGDVAGQHTEGKTWFWEVPGNNLLPAADGPADFALAASESDKTRDLHPVRQGQFLTELDHWQHDGEVLTVAHRLHFVDPQSPDHPVVARLQQRFAPINSSRQMTGWQRTIQVDGVPAQWKLRLNVLPPLLKATAVNNRLEAENLTVESDTFLNDSGQAFISTGKPTTLRYMTDLPVDQLPEIQSETEQRQPAELKIVPGFSAHQLALPADILPTGFSWRKDGVLFITDLKGRVFLTKDTDGDRMEDSAQRYSDELATPFGVRAEPDYVDVVNKYGLLRLIDKDGDGRAERTETVASGWGHTADYHDWAVGMPKTEDGRYFISLACQQDDRSSAAAKYRGAVLELIPSKPTPENPRSYRIQEVSAGHRFPIGIARNPQGDVFVPDNQGNYNPFNELNHVQRGRRYGFLNKLERKPDFAPELTAPAIDIPHPWTRSVNGICFLDQHFGPFDGHLVGCEYDTRRLIRMSLQYVAEGIQGAAYPLSYDHPVGDSPGLLGPISCAVSPSGELYVGNIRESGWGAGQNTGNAVRLRWLKESQPSGISELRATKRGFEIEFTKPIDREKANNSSAYTVESYTRVSTPRYGGSDEGRRREEVASVSVDGSGTQVSLALKHPMRAGYVYEFHLENVSMNNAEFFPATAFYTLRWLIK